MPGVFGTPSRKRRKRGYDKEEGTTSTVAAQSDLSNAGAPLHAMKRLMAFTKRKKKIMPDESKTSGGWDHAKTAVAVIGALADASVNVPGLKLVFGVAAEIIVMAQSEQSNREDAKEIESIVQKSIQMLVEATTKGGMEEAKDAIQAYASVLEEARDDMKCLKSRKVWRRILSSDADRQKIVRAKERLNTGWQGLQTSLDLHNAAVQARIEKQQARNHDAVMARLKQAVDQGTKIVQLIAKSGGERETDYNIDITGASRRLVPVMLKVYSPLEAKLPRVVMDVHSVVLFG
ncbi:hypothetical protein GLOTRDRAFT_141251 [Gloeophyllum trabeum ATCC 11539]|uniref:Mixed lineage kinase domain-containing protein n=1 Tax=Gloeophyllum trabeum (strain ATCC 11539 / FP-39264 / Madison 617) TaxID=670483 RepID=S7RF62_GLOTA|nr:uncharacterized protein GLOTRDRAFT_141251 [Gloeophyllum trabeum ATCC 11539]EPQ51139.1 hypothetical protein GLOTRDRAFT_141251 [Gloeophyllum trabeum ATCC 11539]